MNAIQCSVCDKRFSQNKHLYAHQRNIHKIKPEIIQYRTRNTIICHLCSVIQKCYSDLRDHLVSTHNIDIFKEELNFENKEGKQYNIT